MVRYRGTKDVIDARAHLETLVGRTIQTLTAGRPNRILTISGDDVIVAAARSPQGRPVPIKWVQDAINQLVEQGEIVIDVETVGYRSAFIGAVLATLPGATVVTASPRRVRLRGDSFRLGSD